jgi:hypothetical protein
MTAKQTQWNKDYSNYVKEQTPIIKHYIDELNDLKNLTLLMWRKGFMTEERTQATILTNQVEALLLHLELLLMTDGE